MTIEIWHAEELADIFIGLEDAKKDLVSAFLSRKEGDPTSYHAELIDAAERWDALANALAAWPAVIRSDI